MHLVSIRTTWFTQQKQWGLHQSKVTCSLAAIQRPGYWADNCKMVYSFIYLFIYLFIVIVIAIAIVIAVVIALVIVIVIVIGNICRRYLLLFWVVFPLNNLVSYI